MYGVCTTTVVPPDNYTLFCSELVRVSLGKARSPFGDDLSLTHLSIYEHLRNIV